MEDIRYRQIHLDFHTSEFIDGIGSKFDVKEFAKTLADAKVDSINLFYKGHHGNYYYDTKIGRKHPHLEFDLFGEQLRACKAEGINTYAYTCVGWNEDWAARHPEWLSVKKDGILGTINPFETRYYKWFRICVGNDDMIEYTKQELTEVCKIYGTDLFKGFWIDIVTSPMCVCPSCIKDMKKNNMDPQNDDDVANHSLLNQVKFMKKISEHINKIDPELSYYYNKPDEVDQRDVDEFSYKNIVDLQKFVDIESLPSDSWGYTHFPVNVNYFNKYDKSVTMMNGKFHMAWGDFGSLRNIEALEYESFRALANGAKICVGDQLHPNGQLDKTVYKRIGKVFSEIKQKEKYCYDTTKVSDIGVIIPISSYGVKDIGKNKILEGVYRMLSEMHLPFDFIDFMDDISKYKIIIIPDNVVLNETMAKKMQEYIKTDGKILATGKGGLIDGKFIDGFCCEYEDVAEYCPRYFRIDEDFHPQIGEMDYVMYLQGHTVKATDNSTILSYVVNPYFNRSYDKFCSHRQTPPDNICDEPAIIYNENTAYIASEIFTDYAENGVKVYRQFVEKLLDILYPNKIVKTQLPITAELTLRKQEDNIIVHILNYIIQRKCSSLDTIDEIWPLKNVKVSLLSMSKPTSVKECLTQNEIDFEYMNGRVDFTIPNVDGHQMVLVEY